jgi:TetR/AcrR family transcriptional regulator, transcriptional repressor for nem operon
MARYKSDQHETSHAAILQAASEMVREHGFDGASVVAVMKAVGLTHGGFYAHFSDKADMLAAAMAQALVPTVDRFERFVTAAEVTDDPASVARAYLSDHHVAHPAQGCAAAALVSEVARQPDLVRAAFMGGVTASATILARAFPAGDEGRAWGVFALMSGALALMRAVPDDDMRRSIRARVMQDLRKLAVAD